MSFSENSWRKASKGQANFAQYIYNATSAIERGNAPVAKNNGFEQQDLLKELYGGKILRKLAMQNCINRRDPKTV